jgi:hypothetical protein
MLFCRINKVSCERGKGLLYISGGRSFLPLSVSAVPAIKKYFNINFCVKFEQVRRWPGRCDRSFLLTAPFCLYFSFQTHKFLTGYGRPLPTWPRRPNFGNFGTAASRGPSWAANRAARRPCLTTKNARPLGGRGTRDGSHCWKICKSLPPSPPYVFCLVERRRGQGKFSAVFAEIALKGFPPPASSLVHSEYMCLMSMISVMYAYAYITIFKPTFSKQFVGFCYLLIIYGGV